MDKKIIAILRKIFCLTGPMISLHKIKLSSGLGTFYHVKFLRQFPPVYFVRYGPLFDDSQYKGLCSATEISLN